VTEQLADDTGVVVSNGVVSTKAAEDTLPADFFEEFAATLAKHRAWERDTDPVPA
jgi:catalase